MPTGLRFGAALVGTVRLMESEDGKGGEGSLTLNVEALAKYRDDPVRLEMAAKMLAKNYSGEDDPPLGPAALAAWHDQNRRAHLLVPGAPRRTPPNRGLNFNGFVVGHLRAGSERELRDEPSGAQLVCGEAVAVGSVEVGLFDEADL